MAAINIHEIKARFSYYAKQVLKGHSFVIAYRNKPFAVLSPLEKSTSEQQLTFGVLEGAFNVPDDFNEPLIDFEKDYYS